VIRATNCSFTNNAHGQNFSPSTPIGSSTACLVENPVLPSNLHECHDTIQSANHEMHPYHTPISSGITSSCRPNLPAQNTGYTAGSSGEAEHGSVNPGPVASDAITASVNSQTNGPVVSQFEGTERRLGRVQCGYTGCTKTYRRIYETRRHARKHDAKSTGTVCGVIGNLYSMVPCNKSFLRKDHLLVHQANYLAWNLGVLLESPIAAKIPTALKKKDEARTNSTSFQSFED
jgi:hypothetical protein